MLKYFEGFQSLSEEWEKHKSSNLSTKGLILQLSEKKSMCHQLYTNLQLIDLQRKEHLRGR